MTSSNTSVAQIPAPPDHVPDAEAALEGGMSETHEAPRDVLGECRETIAAQSVALIAKLTGNMTTDNAGTVLTQVARISVTQRKLLADLGDPFLPEQGARSRKRHRMQMGGYGMGDNYLDHETHGAKAIQELLALGMQAVAAHQLPGLVTAAAEAKTAGLDEMASELERRAKKLLTVVPEGPPAPPTPAAVKAVSRVLGAGRPSGMGVLPVPAVSSSAMDEVDGLQDTLDALDDDMEQQGGLAQGPGNMVAMSSDPMDFAG